MRKLEVDRVLQVAGQIAIESLGNVELAEASEAEPGRETVFDGQLARDRRRATVALGELRIGALEVEVEHVPCCDG